jgi:cobalt-zinc-cadmium resistance protein CzcA
LALIFILIFFALRSLKQTTMIYMAIPLAAIGGVFSLWLRDMPFSISAGVGFIVLFGVAVLNGLVLISGWNELKEEGVTDLGERIKQGARRRIRPILLTALTDIFGFLPMAISTSAGAEVQRPLATVVIGGMITATLLTLFVLPILYRWTETRSFRSAMNKGLVTVLFVCVLGAFATSPLKAQTTDSLPAITLEEAVNRAIANYPKLKTARLKIEQQEALKKTAWDLGNTKIFTSGEEIGENGEGVYTTIGIQQQNIDLFGIAPKLKLQDQRIILAEAALDLSELDLRQQVKEAYASAYVARRNLKLYTQLDSVYQDFERAARIRYEVEETSKLAYLAATNQVKQIVLQKEQVEYDYQTALSKLNLWLVSDTLFTVTSLEEELWTRPIASTDSIGEHPVSQLAEQQINVADAERKVATAGYFPKLSGQYGRQKVADQSGFYQFQIGVSVPLFFLPQKAQVQSARIQSQIAEQEYRQVQFEMYAAYQSLLQQYQKWLASWQFYKDEALPLAREQRQGAILAYKEGAIDYVSFIQNLKETIQVEVKAQEALNQYLELKFQLEYYLNSSNQ